MADSFDTIILNNGLDYVTPPLLTKPGVLVDALNYEMTTSLGYRRIDGYERRDGYPTGGISRFYQVIVSESSPGSLVGVFNVGDVLVSDWATDNQKVQGVVVFVGPIVAGTVEVRYVPTDSNLKLQPSDLVSSANNIITSGSVDGRTIITDPTIYLDTIRGYSSTLRGIVQAAPTQIAGLTYSRDRHYEVLNTSFIRIYAASATTPFPGDIVRFRGKRWKFLGSRMPTDSNPNFKGEWHFIDLNTPAAPNNNDIVSLSSPGPGTYVTNQTGPISSVDSYYGYLVYLQSPYLNVVGVRNRVIMNPSVTFGFTLGNTPGDTDGPDLTGLGAGNYYITDSGGFTLIKTVKLTQQIQQSGDFTANTATGLMQVVWDAASTSPRGFIQATDELHTAWPTTGTSRVATVGTNIYSTLLAGTGALRQNNTRYQWGTYNFYGNPNFRQLYGANGVTRGFWADGKLDPPGVIGAGSYGSITTQRDATLDNPKYLTFHAGVQLGFGFAPGSYQISVGGRPYDFEGRRGALEIATGDDITGLLEAQNDSTIIFGRRSIRRVTGTTDTTLALETISANSGAFDYTACNVGTIQVFTGPIGVTTLQAAQEYGDFVNATATAPIYTWLKPKLVPDQGVIELAGVACAMPVRDKQQYRLFLRTGDVVNVTFTDEGTKSMRSNYQQPEQTPMIPFAWSSSIGDDNKEYLEVVWDAQLGLEAGNNTDNPPPENMGYLIDDGWGFDGDVFRHYFDVCWRFVTEGTSSCTIERVRMHGMGYGIAPLDIKSAGLEIDYDQPYHSQIQDISMPATPVLLYDRLQPVTSIIDQANWGLGIKLRINGTISYSGVNVDKTTPTHICQILQLYTSEGLGDR